MQATHYVSITGLRVRRIWHTPIFWRYALAAMAQARQDPGCLIAEARTIDGVHHTRSLWRDQQAMKNYLRNGAHLRAMQQFNRIATGKTLGYAADALPEWDDLHQMWLERGREV